MTHDKWILDVVKGYKIEFIGEPFQFHIPNSLNFSAIEYEAAQKEIEKFLQKQIIEKVNDNHLENTFYSNIFLRPKKDGSFRIILNLKNLNDFVSNHHFKMETLRSVLSNKDKLLVLFSRYQR